MRPTTFSQVRSMMFSAPLGNEHPRGGLPEEVTRGRPSEEAKGGAISFGLLLLAAVVLFLMAKSRKT